MRCLLFFFLVALSGIARAGYAQQVQHDSLKLVLNTLSKTDEQYLHTLWRAMNATIQTNNPQAAAYAREAYHASVNFPALAAEATINFAERLVFIEQLDSADQLLNSFYQSFEANPSDSTHLTKYYLTRGAIESRKAHLKEAGDYYTTAMKLADQRGDLRTAGIALLRIGSMYHREGDFKSALGYYLQAIEYFRIIKNESGLASTYSNISSAYANLEDFKHADLYLDSSLMIEERQDKVDALIASYGNVVINAVEKRKDLQRARVYWEKLQKVAARSTTLRLKGYTHNVNAVYYIGKGEYQQAYSAALEAYKIGKENKIRFVLSIAYQNLVKATRQLNDFERAFFYQQEWNAFKDSINIAEQEKALLELKTRYETESKEAENQRLLQANQQQELLNKILGGGGILLMLMLGSLFYFYKGKQRVNKKLEAHKQQIEMDLREKESLLREIHHRVKNNLQVISSLLNMQSYHVQDQDMIRALAEGQSRVKAMALIHQKLYQTDQLSEIDFQEYTEQLVNHLATAFGQRDQKIKTFVNGGNIKLDIDTAIPLGLILNELITNAYKYAFNAQAEGDLVVELKQDETHYLLSVIDNGPGLPANFNEANLTSLGLKLVRMLIEQLDGSLTIESNKGTHFKIRFKETRVSA